MHMYQSNAAIVERGAGHGTRGEPRSATAHRETGAFIAESVFDPSYERATAALRRWVDGMEAALAQSVPLKMKEVL